MKTFNRITGLFYLCIFLLMTNAEATPENTVIDHHLKALGIIQPQAIKFKNQGQGRIFGQLYDHSSQEPLDDGLTKFRLYLFKKHSRFGGWLFHISMEIEQGFYEFSGLETGQYIIYAIWQPSEESETKYDNAYLTDFWSPNGDYTCRPCEFNQELAITLTESTQDFQADFQLRKASVLSLLLKTDEYDSLSIGPPVYSIDKSGIKRGYEFLDNFYFNKTIYPEPIWLYARFLLPEGEYRIYSENGRFKGRILGIDDNCQSCESLVRSGMGNVFMLSGNQQMTVPSLDLNQPYGVISGTSKTLQMKPNLMDFDRVVPFVKPTIYSGNNSDYPSNFKLTGLDTGYYFLNFNNVIDYYTSPSEPNYFSYSNVYGGNYCDFPHCDYNNLTPIFVRDNKITQIRPHDSAPKGGMIVGNIIDPLTQGGAILTDPGIQSSNIRKHWLTVYDENQKLITTDTVTGLFRLKLPPGKYYLQSGLGLFGFSNRYYTMTLYPDIDCAGLFCDFSKGSLIEVKANEETQINDILLKRGVGIKGRVTSIENEEGLGGIQVEVYDRNQNLVSSELTTADGYYSHWGLLPGDYFVRTKNGNLSIHEQYKIYMPYRGGFVNQLYPNVNCINNQCDFSNTPPITIGSDDISNIDFKLTAGQFFTGTVKDINSGNTLINNRIQIFQSDGAQVGTHLTDKLGGFTTAALIPGDYKILVDGGYLYLDKAVGNDDKDCLFEACELADAQTITLSSEPLDIQLTHKKDVLPHYTGMWFNPEESGHGLQFEVLYQDNAAILYVTWFAHVNGEPMWLTGSGPLLGNRAFVDLIITDGQDFPASMNAKIWGELRVKFDDPNHASMSWQTLLEGFEAGELGVERLTIPTIPEENAYVNAGLNLDACVTGSYYDPERSGEGIQITALGSPSDHLSFNWYTYRGNQQFWFTGQGDFNQDRVESQAYYSKGVNFTPDFDPNQVQLVSWGDVTIRKIPQDKLEVTFTPNEDHSDFEQRTVLLIRNSSPFPMACGLQ